MTTPAGELRREIIDRARHWADSTGAPSYESKNGVLFFESYKPRDVSEHGNLLTTSYQAILADAHWRERLHKRHTGSRFLPAEKRQQARETDSCTSSDALLLSVACHPGAGNMLREAFGRSGLPEFGVGGAVPKRMGGHLRGDETELDMVLRGQRGSIACVVEAKLTEADFATKGESVVESYADLSVVFNIDSLGRNKRGDYDNYQLIRNVLAAHYHGARFFLVYDARRHDLRARLDATLEAVRRAEVVERCSGITWQDLAAASPADLKGFLADKYGIVA